MRIQLPRLHELLEELVSLPQETEWCEFKLNNYNPDEIGKWISGLANSSNLAGEKFGYLVFGIEDTTHNILGTNVLLTKQKKGNEPLQSWLSKMLSPSIDFFIHEFIYKEKQICLVEIPAAIARPVAFQNIEYVRIGEVTKPLRGYPQKEQKIWNNPFNRNFETEIAASGLSKHEILNLLDSVSYLKLVGKPMPDDHSLIINDLMDEEFIIEERGKLSITNMGALMIGSDISNFQTLERHSIRVIFYKGKNRVETQQEYLVKGGYAIKFQDIIELILERLPSNEEIVNALRVDKKVYPAIAIRELVANALIHQDFTLRGTSPMIEIFADRIEISNPGMPLINTSRFIDSVPRSRNEKIAGFMRRVGICEERGSGIDKVIASAEIYQLPAPNIEATEDWTKVTLYSYKDLNKMSKDDKIRACYQHSVLKYVTNEQMSNQTLRKRFKIKDSNYSIASRIIKETQEAGLIKIYGSQTASKSKKYAKYIPSWA